MRIPMKPTSVSIVLAGWFFLLPLYTTSQTVPPGSTENMLKSPLEDYESGVYEMTLSANPMERAAAIYALASIASPRYPSARDHYLSDPSPIIRRSLFKAMEEYGDTSPEAAAFLESCMAGDDEDFCSQALILHRRSLPLPLRFDRLWNPERANHLWRKNAEQFGLDLTCVTGIGAAKPWRDAAWNDLTQDLRIKLLARAGTEESVDLLRGFSELLQQNQLIPAEPVDIPLLDALLSDSNPDFVDYASRSLIEIDDPAHRQRIKDLVNLHLYNSGIADLPENVLKDWAVWAALDAVDTGALKELARSEPKGWFFRIEKELNQRGQPYTYGELIGRDNSSAGPPIDFIPTATLRTFQVQALIRERLYPELPELLQILLSDPQPSRGIAGLNEALIDSPSFTSGIPDTVAKDCTKRLRSWIAERRPERLSFQYDRTGVAEAMRTLGILARGEEAEASWAAWRRSGDPLRDSETYVLVIYGGGPKSQAVRRKLAGVSRRKWFEEVSRGLPGFSGDIIDRWQDDSDECAESGRNTFEYIALLPEMPPSTASLRSSFLAEIDTFPRKSFRDLATMFLDMRGFPSEGMSCHRLATALADPRQSVRRAAHILARDRLPSRWRNSMGTDKTEISRLLLRACAEIPEENSASATRRPPLSAEDEAWLDGLIRRERAAYFQKLVDGFHASGAPAWNSCGPANRDPESGRYDPPTEVTLPSEIFLQAGLEYEVEIRELLGSGDVEIRHAAAWALWSLLHDTGALRVFLKDAGEGAPDARAAALLVLQQIRSPEAKPLYAPLLADENPKLRRVGLIGVGAYRITEALPEVENLVTDPVYGVSLAAVNTLGTLHPVEARPLIIRLLAGDCPLRDAAITALTQYRTPIDIDVFVRVLSKGDTSDGVRWGLLSVLSELTRRPGPQVDFPRGARLRQGPVTADTIHEWEAWWAQYRKKPVEERYKSVIGELVAACLDDGEDFQRQRSMQALYRLFPRFPSISSTRPLPPKTKEILMDWWERNRSRPMWELLTSRDADPLRNPEILFDLDPQRAMRHLYASFQNPLPARIVGEYGGLSAAHDLLVQRSGVDYGDPKQARCGLKARILGDWDAWAGEQGWLE